MSNLYRRLFVAEYRAYTYIIIKSEDNKWHEFLLQCVTVELQSTQPDRCICAWLHSAVCILHKARLDAAVDISRGLKTCGAN